MKKFLIIVIVLVIIVVIWKALSKTDTNNSVNMVGPENPPKSIPLEEQQKQMQTFDKRSPPIVPGEYPLQN